MQTLPLSYLFYYLVPNILGKFTFVNSNQLTGDEAGDGEENR